MLAVNTLRPMSKSLRVLAALLGYPDARLREHLPEMRNVLGDERALSPTRRSELEALGSLVKLLDSQKRRESDEDLWSTLEPRLLDQTQPQPAAGNVRMWAPIGLTLLVYKLIEQIPDRNLAMVYKLLPLLLVTAVFFYLKQNPFKINTELKLEGE